MNEIEQYADFEANVGGSGVGFYSWAAWSRLNTRSPIKTKVEFKEKEVKIGGIIRSSTISHDACNGDNSPRIFTH